MPKVFLESMWTRKQVAEYLGMHLRTTYQQPGLQALAVRVNQRMTRFHPAKVRKWYEELEASILRADGRRYPRRKAK